MNPTAEHAELRAERLRVLLAAAGEESVLDPVAGLEGGLPSLSPAERGLAISASRADCDLASQCINLARELRARQWQALETFLSLIPPGGDEAETMYLPRPLALQAAWAALNCGWLWPAGG